MPSVVNVEMATAVSVASAPRTRRRYGAVTRTRR